MNFVERFKKYGLAVALFFVTVSFSAAFDFTSSVEIAPIERNYGQFAANRFSYLKNMVISLKSSDELTKLKEVNDFWNGVRYGSDKNIWGKKDYWATPYEMLLKDRGDCEDYVIAKYFTLKELGVDTDKLYFVYVRVVGNATPHMVLAYYRSEGESPLILDNINRRIFSADKRKDIIPVYTFNGELLQHFKGSISNSLKEKSMKVKRKWDDLMERMKRFGL